MHGGVFQKFSVKRTKRVIDIDLVVHATRHGLSLADSLIYETALRQDAALDARPPLPGHAEGSLFFQELIA